MYKQIADIIDKIKVYHENLSDYFLALKKKMVDQRTVMLLDYLSKSEKFYGEYLEKYKSTAPKRLMNRWVKFVPWLPSDIFCECREELKISEPLHVYDVLTIATHFDNCLVNFYTVLVQEVQNREAEDLFISLLKASKKHVMDLSRDIAWLNDI